MQTRRTRRLPSWALGLLGWYAAFAGGCAARAAEGRGAAPVVHRVRPGQTLWSIARRHGITAEDLRRRNGLKAGAALEVGQRLTVPSGPRAVARLSRSRPAPGERPARRVARAAAPATSRPPRVALHWPVRGRLTSVFGRRGGRPHDGIDIGAPAGSAVRAAADGEVVFASDHRGYGKVVILRHDRGIMTVYAHHQRNHVRPGQRVRRGQKIAEVGTSGHATGPHLHFEVRHRARPTDPLAFLPRQGPWGRG